MSNLPGNEMERGYLLPPGCKDLIDVLKLRDDAKLVPWGIRRGRKNEMITALQLRVLGVDGQQLGVMERADALNLARSLNIDLVEIAPNANPPVCRLIDYPELARKMSEGEEKSKQDDPGIG